MFQTIVTRHASVSFSFPSFSFPCSSRWHSLACSASRHSKIPVFLTPKLNRMQSFPVPGKLACYQLDSSSTFPRFFYRLPGTLHVSLLPFVTRTLVAQYFNRSTSPLVAWLVDIFPPSLLRFVRTCREDPSRLFTAIAPQASILSNRESSRWVTPFLPSASRWTERE